MIDFEKIKVGDKLYYSEGVSYPILHVTVDIAESDIETEWNGEENKKVKVLNFRAKTDDGNAVYFSSREKNWIFVEKEIGGLLVDVLGTIMHNKPEVTEEMLHRAVEEYYRWNG